MANNIMKLGYSALAKVPETLPAHQMIIQSSNEYIPDEICEGEFLSAALSDRTFPLVVKNR